MSAENTIKTRKLEDIEEECSEDIIEAAAEKFISLFGKTFIEKEPENTDCEDGATADLAAKVVSKIKEKIDNKFSKETVGRLIKLLLDVVKIILKSNDED